MTNVEALQALFVALGGSADTVKNAVTIVDVLNAISYAFGGAADATENAEAIANITAVAGAIHPATQTKTVTPTTSKQNITPDSGKTLSKVTVNAVTAAIDENIVAGNIKSGVTILGVTGSYEG
jgi:hypothetical protein